jgi:hypothetical protein
MLVLAFGHAAKAQTQPIRVGTFHKPSIVVAFYGSPLWADTLKAKRAELAAAKQSGDTEKAKAIDSFGSQSQDLAMRQVMGEAPIDNILEALYPAFAEIAQRTDVAMIVADLSYANASVQTVDVTQPLLIWLKANAKTLKTIQDLKSNIPTR